MAKQHKIKRYRQYGGGTSFRAKPHPVAIVLGALALVALVFVGILIFPPFYDLITKDTGADISELDLASESLPESVSESEEPEPAPASAPEELRAVYIPTATVLDTAARDVFLAALDGTDINAVMVDIKDAAGVVLYNASVPQALEWGAVSATPYDLAALVAALNEKELSLIVRMSAFRDALAATADRKNAVIYQNTEILWLDNAKDKGGKPWLNPYAAGAQDYILALAGEAADAGAVMIVLNDFQFPPYSGSNANFGAESAGVSRAQLLQTFLAEMTGTLGEKNARVAPYLTATSLTQETENVARYGGSPVLSGAGCYLIGALPYQFGGGYNFGGLVVEQPVQNPGGAVLSILDYVAGLPHAEGDAPTLMPLIQGGNEPATGVAAPYTKAQVDAQIAALKSRGANEYILYSTNGEYLLK